MLGIKVENSHWIVQHSIHIVLVRTSIRRVALEYLSDAIDAGSAIESRPEGLLDMLDRVHS